MFSFLTGSKTTEPKLVTPDEITNTTDPLFVPQHPPTETEKLMQELAPHILQVINAKTAVYQEQIDILSGQIQSQAIQLDAAKTKIKEMQSEIDINSAMIEQNHGDIASKIANRERFLKSSLNGVSDQLGELREHVRASSTDDSLAMTVAGIRKLVEHAEEMASQRWDETANNCERLAILENRLNAELADIHACFEDQANVAAYQSDKVEESLQKQIDQLTTTVDRINEHMVANRDHINKEATFTSRLNHHIAETSLWLSSRIRDVEKRIDENDSAFEDLQIDVAEHDLQLHPFGDSPDDGSESETLDRPPCESIPHFFDGLQADIDSVDQFGNEVEFAFNGDENDEVIEFEEWENPDGPTLNAATCHVPHPSTPPFESANDF